MGTSDRKTERRRAAAPPYSTGGGGSSLEDRVAVRYLVSMLVGRQLPELLNGTVRSLAFQAHGHPVDDLLIEADGPVPALAVAVRATPHFVRSNGKTVALIHSLLNEIEALPKEHVAIATSGLSTGALELAKLSDLARFHHSASAFNEALAIAGRHSKAVRQRLQHLKSMVAASGADDEAGERTWQLLRQLHVLPLRIQSPDLEDWSDVATQLDPLASREASGVQLRDRLESLAADLHAAGGSADRGTVVEALHTLLRDDSARTGPGRKMLKTLQQRARSSVRRTIGDAAGYQLPFDMVARELPAALSIASRDCTPLVVTGMSGTGKSAATLGYLEELEMAGSAHGLVLNLRDLPSTAAELQHVLEGTFDSVLHDWSGGNRILVIDGADATTEGKGSSFRAIASAAAKARVGMVAIVADPAAETVMEELGTAFGSKAARLNVTPLDDEGVAAVASNVPVLAAVLRDLPAASLLRRLVIIDLLSRTGQTLTGRLNELDCLELVWRTVIRGEGKGGSGSPQAREDALLAIAAQSLTSSSTTQGSAAPEAIDALRSDHLLAPASVFRPTPAFAHDEVRRYALAVMLIRQGDLVATLTEHEAPRWALSAATLACIGVLAHARNAAETFQQLVVSFHAMSSTHGPRWADVPVEAALATADADTYLTAALADESVPLSLADVLRIAEQRCIVNNMLDAQLSAPAIARLLDHAQPWTKAVDERRLLTAWLSAMLANQQRAGHELRVRLRQRLLAHWASFPSEPTPVPKETAPRRRRRELDYRVRDDDYVAALALLGADIDDEVRGALRAIAKDSPEDLAAAVDDPAGATAIAQHDPRLLAELMEAYYIDNNSEQHIWHLHDDGIREHGQWVPFGPPFAQFWFGGFWALLRSAPIDVSLGLVNRVVNHAARARVERTPSEAPDANEDTGLTLNLTGEPHRYIGDAATWSWYRGTSVGPYPCMSALAATERFLEQILAAGVPLETVLASALHECENLAIPALLYGLLVRRLDDAGTHLDPFLAEPRVWSLEAGRVSNEIFPSFSGFLNPDIEPIASRKLRPTEAAMKLVAAADEQRRDELRRLSEQLVATGIAGGYGQDTLLIWARCLNVSQWSLTHDAEHIFVRVDIPDELRATHEAEERRFERYDTVLRLQNRYRGVTRQQNAVTVTTKEILEDLETARDLVDTETPNVLEPARDTVAHVFGAAIVHAAEYGDDVLAGEAGILAVQSLINIGRSFGEVDARADDSFFDLRADRPVARALPMLLLPGLQPALNRAACSRDDVIAAGLAIAMHAPAETRLMLARGTDFLWQAECTGSRCVHEVAIKWIVELLRHSELGPWDPDKQTVPNVRIDGDVENRLAQLPGELIDVENFDAPLRMLGAAMTNSHCNINTAGNLLDVVIDAQLRGFKQHENSGSRQSGGLLAGARALLRQFALTQEARPLLRYIEAFTDPHDLANVLHAIAGAGAENPPLAVAARAVWPEVVRHVITLAGSGTVRLDDRNWDSWAAAALLPNPPAWTTGIYPELAGEPIDWIDGDDMIGLIDDWLGLGAGYARTVDALIRIIRKLPPQVQAERGLLWVSAACDRPSKLKVFHSYTLAEWLIEVRPHCQSEAQQASWQRFVDALVVAGNAQLAPYSR